MKSALTLTTCLLTASLLCACHQNPLAHADKQRAAALLLSASEAAEAKAGKPMRGLGYVACMTQKPEGLDCIAFFADMVAHARRESEFKALSVSDLQDKTVFTTLQPLYEQARFSSF